jgi:hypothetical protein
VADGKCDLLVGQRVAAGDLFNHSLQHFGRIANARRKMEDGRSTRGLQTQGVFKNGSRHRDEADFRSKSISASPH